MIEFSRVSITYPDAGAPTLVEIDLQIAEGALCLVSGPTGSGKSTLLGAINGLVPHFTGGTLAGRVMVGGRDTSRHPPSAMADLVGYVAQDPGRGFVCELVEEEMAYSMEQHGVAPEVMRTRVEETLDLLGIADLRRRPLTDLSGGEQQRVAIGSVLSMHPSILVLDEPTSALDPAAAEEVLAILHRLVHDVGLTVVLSEHRLERVIQYAEQMVVIRPDGRAISGDPRAVIESADLVPPVVELGRTMGWQPLPLTVREARRAADGIPSSVPPPSPSRLPGGAVARAHRLSVAYGPTVGIDSVNLELRAGEVCVVMGRNGSGKSTLFWALQGGLAPLDGSVSVDGRVALVPQNPADLLYLTTVEAECRRADEDASRPSGSCAGLLARIVPGVDGDSHPGDLSEGQRLALVLAIQLTSQPDLVLLDEPTRGLDYSVKASLAEVVHRLADEGRAVALSTHDVEFAALVADRVVVLAEGEVVADGSARHILTATPLFSPQVARVLAPLPVLTVAQARDLEMSG